MFVDEQSLSERGGVSPLALGRQPALGIFEVGKVSPLNRLLKQCGIAVC